MKKVDSLIKKQTLDEVSQNYSNVVNTLIEEQTKKAKDLKKENHDIQKALYDYARMLVDYAKFDRETMTQIILDLALLYNGEEYKCEKLVIRNGFEDKELVLFFCPVSCDIDILDLKYDKLILNNKFIILRGVFSDMYLDFYYTDRSTDMFSSYKIHARESIEQHYFLRNFVNYVINYRIKNNSKNFLPIDLKRLEQLFICERREEIMEINRQKSLKGREELEQKIGNRELLLKKLIESFEGDAIG